MMKKKLCLMVLIFVLLAMMLPICVTARAGGGGSGGGGGGFSGGHSSSYSTRTYGGRRSSVFSTILSGGIFLIVGGGGSALLVLRLRRSRKKSQAKMYEAAKFDTMWEYDKALEQIQQAFYCIQQAWTQGDVSIAKTYLSDALYKEYESKLSWMEMRGEQNILEQMNLLEVSPIGVHDDWDNSRDYLWCMIRASMIDYTIRKTDFQVISGTPGVS